MYCNTPVVCIVICHIMLYELSYNVVCTVKPQYLKLKLVQDILGCEIQMLKKVLKHQLRLSNKLLSHFQRTHHVNIQDIRYFHIHCIVQCCMYKNTCNVVSNECNDAWVSWYSGPCCT